MSQCKECGATMPENSRFCLQCGTENKPSEGGPPQPERELDFFKPAITGGLLLGVLSSIPLLSALNFLCCLWVQAGGGLATWLLDKQRPGRLRYSDGAFVGVFSGLIGAFVATMISIPIQMLVFTQARVDEMKAQLEQIAAIPAEARDAMVAFMSPGFSLSRTLLTLVMNMILFGLFAMIGGMITTAILARRRLD